MAKVANFKDAASWSPGKNGTCTYGENFVDLPDSTHGIFLAQAHLWRANPESLDKYTDLPWCRGDLFHIERLTLAIEAQR